EHSHSDHQRDP
nr:immunoglobulin light chain junction region [Homo sapiens]